MRAKMDELSQLASKREMECSAATSKASMIEQRFEGIRKKADTNADRVA
jgi:hypothetical protein